MDMNNATCVGYRCLTMFVFMLSFGSISHGGDLLHSGKPGTKPMESIKRLGWTTSHMRVRACDHCTLSTLVGGERRSRSKFALHCA